jgi:hypothetical protein
LVCALQYCAALAVLWCLNAWRSGRGRQGGHLTAPWPGVFIACKIDCGGDYSLNVCILCCDNSGWQFTHLRLLFNFCKQRLFHSSHQSLLYPVKTFYKELGICIGIATGRSMDWFGLEEKREYKVKKTLSSLLLLSMVSQVDCVRPAWF